MKYKMPDYSLAIWKTGLVDKWSTVVTETNHYSVPDFLVGKEVEIELHIDVLRILYQKKEVARHARSYAKNQFSLQLLHYQETLKKKPGALHSSLCLKQSPKICQELFQRFFQENPKEFIALLTTFETYSIFEIHKACHVLQESGARIHNEAIRMILMNQPEPEDMADSESNEIERACLRELRRYAERRAAI